MRSFQELFTGYTKQHGVYSVPTTIEGSKHKGKAWTKEGVPTQEDWQGHLDGTGDGIGILPLCDDDVSAYFGAIDIDIYNLDFAALQKDVEKLPLVITKSKSGGAHLWLFCKEPVDAKLIQSRLKEWASELGFGKSEVFPKQVRRDPTKLDVGNWINLPYYGDSRKCIVKDAELTLGHFLEYANSRLMDAATLEAMRVVDGGSFSDGPPCLQHITKAGIGEGTRNTTLFNIGIYYQRAFPEDWQDRLVKFNIQHLGTRSLPNDEVQQILLTLKKKSYFYQCEQVPLCQHCNKSECLKREFGIGGGDDELNVVLDGFTKLDSDEPLWFLNVDGIRLEITDIAALLDPRQFKILCAERVHKVIPILKPRKWDAVITALFDRLEVIEVPEDVSFSGQLAYHLQQFLELRTQDEFKDRLQNGSAYREGNLVYFRGPDFTAHLQRQGVRVAQPRKIWHELREKYKGNSSSLRLDDGNVIRCWVIDYAGVQRAPSTPPVIHNDDVI